MPYKGERATGESLVALQNSRIFQDFVGRIQQEAADADPPPPPHEQITQVRPLRRQRPFSRIFAIDGSIVTERIENGFPGAEASLVQAALVMIDMNLLTRHEGVKIVPPDAFNNMDSATTLQDILPGCNITREGSTPRVYFRERISEIMNCRLEEGHETLLETFEAITAGRTGTFKCPYNGCENLISIGATHCSCDDRQHIFPTDVLRFHERFNEIGSSAEAHGEVMRFIELMILLNILRYFAASERRLHLLPDFAFVCDGPLAAFGQYAAIVPYVRNEIKRINALCHRTTGEHMMLFSIVKTGQFVEHFERLDFDPDKGPNGRFDPGTALLPNIHYIHQYVVFRAPLGDRPWPDRPGPWGESPPTYFGRTVLYKTRSGQRVVLNMARVTEASDDVERTTLDAFPRLADALDVCDQLSTYLYDDGFLPIVRAHSYAAIPITLGGDILRRLFEERN